MQLDGHDLQLSKTKVKNIGKEYNGRISGDAAIRMAFHIQNYCGGVWELADKMRRHAGRKTIQEEDVLMAIELME